MKQHTGKKMRKVQQEKTKPHSILNQFEIVV